MDCIVDFDGDIVNCFVFWLYHRGGIWFLGYLVSVSVLYGCKLYCIILLYQTLFYLLLGDPPKATPPRNKVLIRPYKGKPMVTSPLIYKALFIGGGVP